MRCDHDDVEMSTEEEVSLTDKLVITGQEDRSSFYLDFSRSIDANIEKVMIKKVKV